ncbi:MAG TPA: InlB B-repeat-containing protein [Natronincola sp.]|nr:InlB B-repeat-containing protein [Natronincola sp.]
MFDGWFADGEFTEKVTEIKYGSSGNIDLYAKWLPFTFDPHTGTITAYNTTGGEYVIIPAKINDVEVIVPEAFLGKNLKSVDIPFGVTGL